MILHFKLVNSNYLMRGRAVSPEPSLIVSAIRAVFIELALIMFKVKQSDAIWISFQAR